jgi:hypothetical protein
MRKERSVKVLYGTYRMEGNVVYAIVKNDAKTTSKWTFLLCNSELGSSFSTRLIVTSMVLCEGGAATGERLGTVEGLDFIFEPVVDWGKKA